MASRVTIIFAVQGGGKRALQVVVTDPCDTSSVIKAGVLEAKLKGLHVANVLGVRCGEAVTFDPRIDLTFSRKAGDRRRRHRRAS